MPTFEELKKHSYVSSHTLFNKMEQRIEKMRAAMTKTSDHGLDLIDIFSAQKQVGVTSGDRTINAFIQQAAIAAQSALDVLDFPIPPKVSYNNAKNVKHAHADSVTVIDADILFNVRFATISGAVRQFVLPVRVNRGEVVPPATMIFEDRTHVLGQSTVDTIVRRNTSYALEPMRPKWNSPPLRDEEIDIAAELRNTRGYQPREFSSENVLTRSLASREAQVAGEDKQYNIEVIDALNDQEVQNVWEYGRDNALEKFHQFVDKYVAGRGEQYVVQLVDNDYPDLVLVDTGGIDNAVRGEEEFLMGPYGGRNAQLFEETPEGLEGDPYVQEQYKLLQSTGLAPDEAMDAAVGNYLQQMSGIEYPEGLTEVSGLAAEPEVQKYYKLYQSSGLAPEEAMNQAINEYLQGGMSVDPVTAKRVARYVVSRTKLPALKQGQFWQNLLPSEDVLTPGTTPAIQLEKGQEGDWGGFLNEATQTAYNQIVNDPSVYGKAAELAKASLNTSIFAKQLESDPAFQNVYSADVVLEPLFGKSEFQTKGSIDWTAIANALLSAGAQTQEMSSTGPVAKNSQEDSYQIKCPVCDAQKVAGCRCSSKVLPHSLEQLRKGHGNECENGHTWSGELAIDGEGQEVKFAKKAQVTDNTVPAAPAALGQDPSFVDQNTVYQKPGDAPVQTPTVPQYQGTGDPTGDMYQQILAQPQIMEMVKYAMQEPYIEDQVKYMYDAALPLAQSIGANPDVVDWYALTEDLIKYVGFDVQEVSAKKVAKIMAKHIVKAQEDDAVPGKLEEMELQKFTPPAYDVVLGDMVQAEEEGFDTFPRAYAHVEKNYILKRVGTCSKDAWFPHLLNDGFILNPYGTNRGRLGKPDQGKRAQMEGGERPFDNQGAGREEGHYLTFEKGKNGLTISPTPEGIEYAKDWMEGRERDDSYSYFTALSDMLEDHIVSSEWEIIGETGDGLALSEDSTFAEDEYELVDVGTVYWFEQYAVKMEIEEWANGNSIFLQLVEA